MPAVPVHTWLPDAHVEAPTPISMILAGVLLKMGGYGIIRICYPICPDAGYDLAWLVCGLGVVSMVYGAFAALAQKDFKRLVAYSSVSHMGYVVLGIGVWSAVAGTGFNADYWKMGMNGAMFQMWPTASARPACSSWWAWSTNGCTTATWISSAGCSPGCRSTPAWRWAFSSPAWACRACADSSAKCSSSCRSGTTAWRWPWWPASVVILTAGYILWTMQRVYLGPEYKGPHGEALTPMTRREVAIAAPLLALAILFGVFPQAIFHYMTPSVNETVDELADWTENVKEPRLRARPASPDRSGSKAAGRRPPAGIVTGATP